MSDSEVKQGDRTDSAADQLSNMYDLLGLSLRMFDGRSREAIIQLATMFIASLRGCEFTASFEAENTEPAANDHIVDLPRQRDNQWRWALGDLGSSTGRLVITSSRPPLDAEMLQLKALMQLTAAALANVEHSQRESMHAMEIHRLTEEKTTVEITLAAEVRRQRAAHEVLVKASKSRDGEAGIARTLHELTGLAVAVEDRFGNLRAWAGPGRPDPYPKADPRRRGDILRQAAQRGGVIRDRYRLFVLVQPRSDVVGVLALIDPHRTAGDLEVFALEHSAMALALELTHRKNLADVELRLRRDLVDDLVTGTDNASAYLRSEAVGHDLHGAHHVIAARWSSGSEDDLTTALARAVSHLELSALMAWRTGMVIALLRGHPPGVALHRVISQQMGTGAGAIGVGGRCDEPSQFARSFGEARRALDIRLKSRAPNGVTNFDELGVLRILHRENESEIHTFVHEWLGELLDYDLRRNTDLVQTLSHYLDCGGNYDETASALLIHRSTLRYRLQRIRDITELDLSNVDTRLNLHVATRAWQVLGASAPLGG
jgi:hypothetical protein